MHNIDQINKAVEETYYDDCLCSFIIDPDLPHYALLHPTRLEHFQTFFFNNPVNNVFSKLSFPDVTVLKVHQQPEYTIYSQDGDVIYSTEEENKRKEVSAIDTVTFKNYSFPFEEDWERMRQRLSEKNLKNKMKEHGMYSILCKAQIGGAECDIHIKAALRAWQEEWGDGCEGTGEGWMRFEAGREYIFLWVSRTSLVNGATRMYRDALTRVKNKNAYMGWEAKHNDKIKNGTLAPLAIVVCDLNELKEVNDTLGHRAGDEYIKKASSIICNIFVHSPVFRIGGDEFVVAVMGQDYENRDELLRKLDLLNAEALNDNSVIRKNAEGSQVEDQKEGEEGKQEVEAGKKVAGNKVSDGGVGEEEREEGEKREEREKGREGEKGEDTDIAAAQQIKPIIAHGMAEYSGEESVGELFDKADRKMYECKERLKAESTEAGSRRRR